ncbi:MAG: UDP-N-acetylmuramate--L-alanine ligase, partial [Verrucomicrobiia bacterium]
SLPELLKETFIRGKRSIVIAGTHGKTTTTALLTWVFEHNGLNPSYVIGGIPNNFSQGARFTDSEWFIIEGDEYDTAFFDKRSKFVHYLPEVAVLNNLEFDHADIFENLAQIQKSFRQFINLIPRNGLLIANGDDANIAPLLEIGHCPIQRFSLADAGDLEFPVEGSRFSVDGAEFVLPLFGELNVRNALAVIAVARHCGLGDSQIQSAFDSFEGIKRRMEVRGEARGVTVIDDFAHHPTANRRLWAVFEPRSNSTRRSVFQDDLAAAFGDADKVVVAKVARLDQIPEAERLDAERLIVDVQTYGAEAAYLPDVDAIVNHVTAQAAEGDVVCVLSNGSFGGIHEKLLAALKA